MKVNIFPIVSSLHKEDKISLDTKLLLQDLFDNSQYEYNIVEIDELYNCDLSLILVQSGGSEQLFLQNYDRLKPPYYLLTYGNNNSLAASLEILSYLKDNGLDGEVLHGNTNYLVKRINELVNDKVEGLYRYGVIGKPSDWLIASNVDYSIAAKLHNIELVDIDINEVVDIYERDKKSYKEKKFIFDDNELSKALKLDSTLNEIKNKYNLNGLTIRCFSLLNRLNTTSCLSLALLNQKHIISSCEGDIPTLISMHVLNKVSNQVGFQANPSRIDIDSRKMIFAHCTLPLDMNTSYSFDTHFESGIGIAVKGVLKEEIVTIFKLSRNLKDYYVTTGKILRNLNETNLCRTQIEVLVDDNIEYFLNRPYGNHHVIIYGDYKSMIEEYMNNIK